MHICTGNSADPGETRVKIGGSHYMLFLGHVYTRHLYTGLEGSKWGDDKPGRNGEWMESLKAIRLMTIPPSKVFGVLYGGGQSPNLNSSI